MSQVLESAGLDGLSIREAAKETRRALSSLLNAITTLESHPFEYDLELAQDVHARLCSEEISRLTRTSLQLQDAFALKLDLATRPVGEREVSARSREEALEQYRRLGDLAGERLLESLYAEAIATEWLRQVGSDGRTLRAILSHKQSRVRGIPIWSYSSLMETKERRAVLRDVVLPHIFQTDRAIKLRRRAAELLGKLFPDAARDLFQDEDSVRRCLRNLHPWYSSASTISLILYSSVLTSADLRAIAQLYEGSSPYARNPVLFAMRERTDILTPELQSRIEHLTHGAQRPQRWFT